MIFLFFLKSEQTFLKKIYKLSKTNKFFSRFEGTRGEINQIFCTLGYSHHQKAVIVDAPIDHQPSYCDSTAGEERLKPG